MHCRSQCCARSALDQRACCSHLGAMNGPRCPAARAALGCHRLAAAAVLALALVLHAHVWAQVARSPRRFPGAPRPLLAPRPFPLKTPRQTPICQIPTRYQCSARARRRPPGPLCRVKRPASAALGGVPSTTRSPAQGSRVRQPWTSAAAAQPAPAAPVLRAAAAARAGGPSSAARPGTPKHSPQRAAAGAGAPVRLTCYCWPFLADTLANF